MKYLKLFESRLPGITNGNVSSWVNIKIDNDLWIRVSRYSRALESYIPNSMTLREKLGILSDPLKYSNMGIQCQLNIVMLLQYLKEVKNNFDSTSSGLLFENYISGLVHKQKYGGRNSTTPYDFEDDENKLYQIKFIADSYDNYKVGSSTDQDKLCDYYIIGLKSETSAKIWILDYNDDSHRNHFFERNETKVRKGLVNTLWLNIRSLKKDINIQPIELKYQNIDGVIKKIDKLVQEDIEQLYTNISNLEYDIESIMTGVDRNENIINISEMDGYVDKCNGYIKSINDCIGKMKKGIIENLKRKRVTRNLFR
jgi:hypothetical protein